GRKVFKTTVNRKHSRVSPDFGMFFNIPRYGAVTFGLPFLDKLALYRHNLRFLLLNWNYQRWPEVQ
ncbi:MAG: hypothetical protein DI617_05265, partial [Streptococcus pyogenes]